MPPANKVEGSFRGAVMAAAVAFVGPKRLPESVRTVGRNVADRILHWLDARRARLDAEFAPHESANGTR
jgi:hypothetical protein